MKLTPMNAGAHRRWRYLILGMCTLISTTAAVPCPNKCNCLKDSTHPDLVKLECHWTRIRAKLPFSDFPSDSVRTLSIICDTKTDNFVQTSSLSSYKARMFAIFKRLERLHLSGCTAAPDRTILPADVFGALPFLKSLRLDAMPGLVMADRTFKNLDRLEQLEITQCGLGSLPALSICDLSNLQMLNLSHNSILKMTAIGIPDDRDAVTCVQQLVLLDLSNNKIAQMSPAVLQGMSTLRALYLSDNKLQKIPAKTFNSTSQVSRISLNRNEIDEVLDLPGRASWLDISENRLTAWPLALQRMSNLIHVNISHNHLNKLHFDHDTVQEIDVSHNEFSHIAQSMFVDKKQLRSVRISNNKVTQIDEQAFRGTSSLTQLDISHNALTEVPALGARNLTELMLNNNGIDAFEEDLFPQLQQLTVLELSANQLTALPASITQLKQLQSLNLATNRIASIAKFLFTKFPALLNLNLSHNHMASIERYIFDDIKTLQKLDLSWNDITVVEAQSFDRSHSLTLLDLSHNYIESIAGIVHDIVALGVLRLEHNRLLALDIGELPESLRTLTAMNNHIVHMRNSQPQRAIALNYMDVSSNQLLQLSYDVLPGKLVTLNISDNAIAHIAEKTLRNCRHLTSLDLSNNKLRSLSYKAIDRTSNENSQPLRDMMRLYLASNPWQCSCELEWLTATDEHSIQLKDAGRTQCTHAVQHTTHDLDKLTTADLLCEYTELCVQCDCCGYTGCDCKSVCPSGCTCTYNSLGTNIVQCSGLNRTIDVRQMPMYATELHLDGLHMPTIDPNSFFGRFTLQKLFLNNSNVLKIEPKAFNGLNKLKVLDLSDNQLQAIDQQQLRNLSQLQELMLSGNQLNTLSDDLFVPLTTLQSVTLHHNQLQTLPTAVKLVDKRLKRMTLAGNPWRCDCDNKYELQRWLPKHRKMVLDQIDIECMENTFSTDNSSGVLQLLPATELGLIKVNFWTFRHELSQSLCDTKAQLAPQITVDMPITNNLDDTGFEHMSVITLIVLAVAAVACLVLIITLIILRTRQTPNTRKGHNHSQSSSLRHAAYGHVPQSMNSTSTASTTPMLGSDAFITYSRWDTPAVEDMATRMENEYYRVSLLHEHTECTEFHAVPDDLLLRKIEQSQCNILYLSPSFLENEWKTSLIRIIINVLKARDKPSQLLIITSPDLDIGNCRLEDPLDRILRTNKLIKREDPRFWELLLEALPPRLDDSGSSNGGQYSNVYGTIIDSQLV